ncbi:MAG: hypothetical protein CML13_02395 [Puniceicoccaceae bacterium]|mgnify:CR=1 FL=1|nr:hypothetical protein [Puniceicoccaceae bacterium]|tara:strand:+ start:12866 stop:13660 length:795 start_codon:yes stop_codon:yes gene_type:complete
MILAVTKINKTKIRCKKWQYLLKLILLALTLNTAGHSYTFTSNDGASFEGQILQVEGNTVTVVRDSDKKEFSLPQSRFSEKDQAYFKQWAKENPQLNLPGRNVTQISLRCTTARTNDESIIRETGRTLIDVNVSSSVYWDYDWITVETTVTATARAETEKVRLKGATVHVKASSVSGPVFARIYTAFFVKSGGGAKIFKVDERNVRIDLGQGELYASCNPVENYYGYGTVAINLATGHMIGVAGSNHQIEQLMKKKVSSGNLSQ